MLLTLPHILLEQFPLTPVIEQHIQHARTTIDNILQGRDKRLLVIVGPCSIHDYSAALEYAALLKKAISHFSEKLFLVMRVYFEKPRTSMGWKGFINDPFIDNTFQMNEGLRLARKLLLEINQLGIPVATEFLDPLIPTYLSDLISWVAIGARTSASQLYRELASNLMMPVGFKNSIDGNIKVAIDAVKFARHSHHFLNFNEYGIPVIKQTPGNKMGHIVLRGSEEKSNYDLICIEEAAQALKLAELTPRLIVDCSHGNSDKQYEKQITVVDSLLSGIQQGRQTVAGIMLESHLLEGNQPIGKPLIYGKSITDGCLSWPQTEEILSKVAELIASRTT